MIRRLKYFHDTVNIVVISAPGLFSSETVTIHFWDKPYQRINFKSHSNTVILCKLGKILLDLHMSLWFYFILLVCAQFFNAIERCQL